MSRPKWNAHLGTVAKSSCTGAVKLKKHKTVSSQVHPIAEEQSKRKCHFTFERACRLKRASRKKKYGPACKEVGEESCCSFNLCDALNENHKLRNSKLGKREFENNNYQDDNVEVQNPKSSECARQVFQDQNSERTVDTKRRV